MDKPSSPPADRTDIDRTAVKRLLLFFAVVYVVEGVGQIGGLIAQPLSYLSERGRTAGPPVQVTAYLAVFNFRWIIKPVYGVFSDFVPLFGYRRKTYLIGANVVAIAAYLLGDAADAPGDARLGAAAHRLCDGDIEHGVRRGAGRERPAARRKRTLRQSAVALVQCRDHGLGDGRRPTGTAAFARGRVACRRRDRRHRAGRGVAGNAVSGARGKNPFRQGPLRSAVRGLGAAFRKRELWIVGLFLFLYYFSPGFATPLLLRDDRHLQFEQGFIGILGSITSAGWIVGALLYPKLFEDMSSRRLLNLSIALGTIDHRRLSVALPMRRRPRS